MASYTDKETDRELNNLIGKISSVYDDALSEVSKTASDYFASYKKRWEQEHKAYEEGKYTKQQFDAWQMAQLGRGERWKKVRDGIASRLAEANVAAAAYVNDTTPGIYTLNANYSAYEIEKGTGAVFDIYDEQTVKGLITGRTKIMPQSRVKVDESEKWNVNKLQNALTSAILQGKDIRQLADAFQSVCNMNRNAAVRNARTSMTDAQNAGRQASYEQAAELGIEIKKEWIATIDERTRESHAELDGVQVPYNEKYPNGLRWPGDEAGEPGEFYNCRCTQRAIFPKYNGEQRKSEIIGHEGIHTKETYKEWLDRKREEKMRNSKPTTHADASARAMESKENNLHLGAKDSEVGKPSPTWQESTVDFTDNKKVLNKIAVYEKQFGSLDYEMCATITDDGKIWVAEGSAIDVNPVIPSSLEGCYMYHNHPKEVTEYSFSVEDISCFLENKVGYSKASDYKYEYIMERQPNTKNATKDEIIQRDYEIWRDIGLELSSEGLIDADYDIRDAVNKVLAEEYNFRYMRVER